MDWLEEIRARQQGAMPYDKYEKTFRDEVWFMHHIEEIIKGYREDIPRLIAEVERLRGLVAQAEWLGADSVGNYGTSCQYCGVIRVVRDTGRLRDHAPSCPAFSAPGVVR